MMNYYSVRVIAHPTKTFTVLPLKNSKLKMTAEPPGTPLAGEAATNPPVKGGPEFWRRSFSYITGMGMTDEDRARFENKRIEEECRRCEKQRNYLMKYSICSARN